MASSPTSFDIGYFGDARLEKAGAQIFHRIIDRGTLLIRDLATDRAEQARFERFLRHNSVTEEEMKAVNFAKVASLAADVDHILAIQDTTELKFDHRRDDIDGLGVLKNRNAVGYYLHPVLAIDAKDEFVLGVCGLTDFSYEIDRAPADPYKQKRKPIEEKESMRWLSSADQAKKTLRDARMVTFISDRESDIYEYMARIPDEKTHLIVRSRLDRFAEAWIGGSDKKTLAQVINNLPVSDTRQIEIPARRSSKTVSGKVGKQGDRLKRVATLEIKFATVYISKPGSRSLNKSPSDPETICMTVVDVKEVLPAEVVLPTGNKPLHWCLLTTQPVASVSDAWQIVEWYKMRWHIEQLFRSAKSNGMRLEEIALSEGASLKKLALLGLFASVRILQLTLSRNAQSERPAKQCFSKEECDVLERLNVKYQGKTDKQKNPYKHLSMAWAYWVIARMGGWKGYVNSEGPAGPLTLKRGLDRLSATADGWRLAIGSIKL